MVWPPRDRTSRGSIDNLHSSRSGHRKPAPEPDTGSSAEAGCSPDLELLAEYCDFYQSRERPEESSWSNHHADFMARRRLSEKTKVAEPAGRARSTTSREWPPTEGFEPWGCGQKSFLAFMRSKPRQYGDGDDDGACGALCDGHDAPSASLPATVGLSPSLPNPVSLHLKLWLAPVPKN